MFIINILAGLLILTSVAVIVAKTARKSTIFYTLQSFVLVLLFIFLASEMQAHELHLWSIGAFITKVILVPAILFYAIKKLDDQPQESILQNVWLIPIVAAIVVLCYLVVSPLTLPLAANLKPVLSVSLGHFLLGLLCIVSQRNILKQVFGYCLMENGSHLTLALLANKAPELVEIGVATDAIFAVIIMVVLVHKIYRQLNTLDAKQLMELKG